MTLRTPRVRTLEQVRRVAEGNEPVDVAVADRESAYEFIRRTLVEFSDTTLSKSDQGAVKADLAKMAGLSRAQLTRWMAQNRETGRICDRRGGGPARPFVRRHSAADVRLLADVDAALGQRCGPATRAVLRRQLELFGDERFERLAGLSNGHLYSLRKSQSYRRKRTVFTKTEARTVAIGERRKPRSGGQPGFLRVDTVHQGDRDLPRRWSANQAGVSSEGWPFGADGRPALSRTQPALAFANILFIRQWSAGDRAARTRSCIVTAEPFEQPLENLEIASVVDDESPCLGVDSCGAPKRLRECRLESPDIGIGIESHVVGLMRTDPCTADPTSLRRSLGLPHREALPDDSLGQTRLPTSVLHRHERPSMAGRELTSGNEMLDSNRKLQQTQGVGDVSAGRAERAGEASNRTVATVAIARAQALKLRLEATRLLNRV